MAVQIALHFEPPLTEEPIVVRGVPPLDGSNVVHQMASQLLSYSPFRLASPANLKTEYTPHSANTGQLLVQIAGIYIHVF